MNKSETKDPHSTQKICPFIVILLCLIIGLIACSISESEPIYVGILKDASYTRGNFWGGSGWLLTFEDGTVMNYRGAKPKLWEIGKTYNVYEDGSGWIHIKENK